jgi:hypothetical protein
MAVRDSIDPKAAWTRAAAILFPNSPSSRNKGCPKGAFLGLCEEGVVQGIPKGRYTRSLDNKRYALAAVRVLAKRPQLAEDRTALWQTIPAHPLHENNQMDVVISLWKQSLLEQPSE